MPDFKHLCNPVAKPGCCHARQDIENFDTLESELCKRGAQYCIQRPGPGTEKKIWVFKGEVRK